jgi:hypothetical protein
MENFAMMAAVTRPPTLAAKTNPINPISWQMLSSMLYYRSLGNMIRDQSLLMPGRGPEEILRGHQKFLSCEGGVRK